MLRHPPAPKRTAPTHRVAAATIAVAMLAAAGAAPAAPGPAGEPDTTDLQRWVEASAAAAWTAGQDDAGGRRRSKAAPVRIEVRLGSLGAGLGFPPAPASSLRAAERSPGGPSHIGALRRKRLGL